MRVAFVTDLHITQARLWEHRPVLKQLALSIWGREPDLLLVGGDLCGLRVPHRATPDERNALVDFLRTAVDDTGTPIVVVRGNHDAPSDYDFLNYLAIDCAYVTEPEVIEGDGWQVLCLPWIDRSQVADPERYQEEARREYRQAIEGVAQDAADGELDGPVFLLGHVAIRGGLIGHGQPIVPTADPVVELSDLDGPFAGCFLGHFHRPQPLQPSDPPIVYGGSVHVNEYGEDDRKAWVLWEDGQITWNPIHGIRRVTLDLDDQGEVLSVKPGPDTLDGDLSSARLKIRVRVTESTTDAALVVGAKARAQYGEQAKSIRVEYLPRVQHKTRDGADQVAGAVTVTDKVRVFLGRMERPPKKATVDRALQILDELQHETHK